LLKAGEKAAEETGKTVAGQSWEWTKSLWSKLKPKVEEKPAALEAAQDVAQMPDHADAQGALRLQLFKLLTEDESLAEEVSRWLEQGRAAGFTVTASGDHSVAIGGDARGNTIITGDRTR
jgi:arginase family enzyme